MPRKLCLIIIDFFPFGSTSGDTFLPLRLDVVSSELTTPIPCPYFGTNEASLFVS